MTPLPRANGKGRLPFFTIVISRRWRRRHKLVNRTKQRACEHNKTIRRPPATRQQSVSGKLQRRLGSPERFVRSLDIVNRLEHSIAERAGNKTRVVNELDKLRLLFFRDRARRRIIAVRHLIPTGVFRNVSELVLEVTDLGGSEGIIRGDEGDGVCPVVELLLAMAGEVVAMSPVSMLMIHNPATLAVGDADELGRAIDMLAAVKESIINAYELKTGMSRAKLARLMDQETWMDARAAIAMGFADDYLTGSRTPPDPDDEDKDEDEDEQPDKQAPWPPKSHYSAPLSDTANGVCFARKPAEQRLVAHLNDTPPATQPPDPELMLPVGRKVVDLYAALINHTH